MKSDTKCGLKNIKQMPNNNSQIDHTSKIKSGH